MTIENKCLIRDYNTPAKEAVSVTAEEYLDEILYPIVKTCELISSDLFETSQSLTTHNIYRDKKKRIQYHIIAIGSKHNHLFAHTRNTCIVEHYDLGTLLYPKKKHLSVFDEFASKRVREQLGIER